MARSTAIVDRVVAGMLAIVCLTYQLPEGRVVLHDYLGNVGEQP